MIKHAWLGLLLVGCDVAQTECDRAERFPAYVDADGDGFGSGEAQEVCALTDGLVDNATDCNDDSADVFPGADELCNALDDDCDGTIDDGLPGRSYFADVDGDGFGGLFPSVRSCIAPEGFVRNSIDCDDDNSEVHPDMDEVCNDGLDDNCDGLADDADPATLESSKTTYYPDTDVDGFGWINLPEPRCEGVAGLVDNFRDCDDMDPTVTNFPFPIDKDLDGYGDEIGTIMSCEGYPGTADNRDDCDDSDAWVNIPRFWYDDPDEDGYGEGDPESFGCFPPNGLLVGPYFGDCDQTDPDIFVDAIEVCDDGIDQDCDDRTDCDDSDCALVSSCWQECVDIGLASDVPLTMNIGLLAPYGNDVTIPCVQGNEDDVALQWRAPEDGTYEFNTFDSTIRTGPGIAVYDSCDTDARLFGCNAASGIPGNRNQGQVRGVVLSKDQVVIIKIDGQRRGGTGDAVLNILKE